MTSDRIEWYWDLANNRPVRADERGPGDQVLGPYPSEAAARQWRDTVEQRNQAWEDADEDWHREADDPS